VFTDVDLAATTSISFFGPGNTVLGTFSVPATVGSETFSFLGVSFSEGERIACVRTVNGNVALGAGTDQNGHLRDVLVMDDFRYGEPTAIREPGVVVLLTGALALLSIARRRRGPRL
jgi:hypothetical protein